MNLKPRTISPGTANVLGVETFQRDVSEVTRARHWIAGEVLPGLDPKGQARDALQICTSECATNAVRHGDAGSEFGVIVVRCPSSAARPSAIRVEIIDGGNSQKGAPRMLPDNPNGFAQKGRGLRIVAEYATAWGYGKDPDGSGHVVWFEIPDEQPDAP
ncbi:ATP-binding protein [Actinomadura sp. 9N215]|uniref:ATP-binding protein n=1 Tax=Actinomadura sp. 9N215 TaxID=3375150 RepID=UPI0037B1F10A